MSLYRKHRPQKFSDLIGQDHIRQTLTNALESNNFAHAYLFSGPKGSGKTTTARLLAKALNCRGRNLSKGSHEPCNKCLTCKEITLGNNLDIIEIDAASNRGIDEIRDLRDKVRFAPSNNRYKIYIIDECHMLTKEAFNALLKTLEEPPGHAIFILATTELHKVPPTIMSRTQAFEFKKATRADTLKLLNKVAKLENIKIDDLSLALIARLSSGAFRDALSMLDQVSTLGIDGRHTITLLETQTILGQATENEVWDFMENLALKNRSQALKIISQINAAGKDLENFTTQVVNLFRQILLIKEGLKSDFEHTPQEEKLLQNISEVITLEELLKIIDTLLSVIPKVKTLVLGELPLEMAVFELTKKTVVLNLPQEKIIAPEKPQSEPPAEIMSQISPSTLLTPSPFDEAKWPEVIKLVKAHNNTIAAMIKNTVFHKTTAGHIILAVKFKFHAEQICNKKNLCLIEEAITKVTGKNYKIECIVDKNLSLKKPLDADEELLNGTKEVFEVEE